MCKTTIQVVKSLWEKELNQKDMQITSNFFDMGGNSLKAIKLLSRIFVELDVEVTVEELFNNPTIIELSEYIKGLEKERYEQIKKAEVKDYYSLSPAQKRMYTIQQLDKNSISYNLP